MAKKLGKIVEVSNHYLIKVKTINLGLIAKTNVDKVIYEASVKLIENKQKHSIINYLWKFKTASKNQDK